MLNELEFPLLPGSTYSPEDDVLDAIPGDDMAYEDTPEGDMVGRDKDGAVSGLIVQGARNRIRRDGGLYSTLPGLGRVRIAGAEGIVLTQRHGRAPGPKPRRRVGQPR